MLRYLRASTWPGRAQARTTRDAGQPRAARRRHGALLSEREMSMPHAPHAKTPARRLSAWLLAALTAAPPWFPVSRGRRASRSSPARPASRRRRPHRDPRRATARSSTTGLRHPGARDRALRAAERAGARAQPRLGRPDPDRRRAPRERHRLHRQPGRHLLRRPGDRARRAPGGGGRRHLERRLPRGHRPLRPLRARWRTRHRSRRAPSSLLGRSVANHGSIDAPDGTIALVAGEQVVLTQLGAASTWRWTATRRARPASSRPAASTPAEAARSSRSATTTRSRSTTAA